jgi:hypothetical protein
LSDYEKNLQSNNQNEQTAKINTRIDNDYFHINWSNFHIKWSHIIPEIFTVIFRYSHIKRKQNFCTENLVNSQSLLWTILFLCIHSTDASFLNNLHIYIHWTTLILHSFPVCHDFIFIFLFLFLYQLQAYFSFITDNESKTIKSQ